VMYIFFSPPLRRVPSTVEKDFPLHRNRPHTTSSLNCRKKQATARHFFESCFPRRIGRSYASQQVGDYYDGSENIISEVVKSSCITR